MTAFKKMPESSLCADDVYSGRTVPNVSVKSFVVSNLE